MRTIKEIDTNISALSTAANKLSAKIDELEHEKWELQNQISKLREEKRELCVHPNGYDSEYWCNNRPYKFCGICGKE